MAKNDRQNDNGPTPDLAAQLAALQAQLAEANAAKLAAETRATAAEMAAKTRQTGVAFSVGQSGTMVITGVTSRGVALYHGQALRLFTQDVFDRATVWLAENVKHLATRDDKGNNLPPAEPADNYNGGKGATGKATTPASAPAESIADRAARVAAETMAARDAATAQQS